MRAQSGFHGGRNRSFENMEASSGSLKDDGGPARRGPRRGARLIIAQVNPESLARYRSCVLVSFRTAGTTTT